MVTRENKHRVIKNISYIPVKPHGVYYQPYPKTRPNDPMVSRVNPKYFYNPNPHVSPHVNIFDAYHYKKQHTQIKKIMSSSIYFSKNNAIAIWSFVKLMLRTMLDRVWELFLSTGSFIKEHGKVLNNYLKVNIPVNRQTIDGIKKFKQDVVAHIKTINKMSSFLFKNSYFYEKSILRILRFNIKDTTKYNQISDFIKKYFVGVRGIVQSIDINMKSIHKKVDDYTKSILEYIRGEHEMTNNILQRKKQILLKKFSELSTGSVKFNELLILIKAREISNNNHFKVFKVLTNRSISNKRLPL